MSTCKSSSAACQPRVHTGEGTDGRGGSEGLSGALGFPALPTTCLWPPGWSSTPTATAMTRRRKKMCSLNTATGLASWK